MTNYRATPENWEAMERWAKSNDNACSCILELRARVEALEANAKPTPNDRQIRSSLVELVAATLAAMTHSDPGDTWELEARAAIREVAAWFELGAEQGSVLWEAAETLKEELEINP